MTDRAVSLVRKASRGMVPRIPVVHCSHKQVNGGSEEALERGFEQHPFVLKSVSDLAHELRSVDIVELGSSETIQTIIVFP